MLTSKPEEFDHDTAKYSVEKHGDVVCHYFKEGLKSYLIYKKYSDGREYYWNLLCFRHRLFGPAIKLKKMSGYKDLYYINNIEFSFEDYWREMEKYEKHNKVLKDYPSYWNF